MPSDLIKLSKILSHALRHDPQSYNLQLDKEGWVNLSDVLVSLKHRGFPFVTEHDLVLMIEKSEKKRHQIIDGRIRAVYGHSIKEKIDKTVTEPPFILYHGTVISNIESIRNKGLLAMERQYVHLSADIKTAKLVAGRRQGAIVILVIQAHEAFAGGISFYQEENNIWLSEPIAPKYINFDGID